MAIITTQNEKSLDQLLKARYGKLTSAQLKTIRQDVLAANPHLSATAKLAPGMVVVMPELPRGPRVSAVNRVSGETVKTLSAALTAFRQTMTQNVDDSKAELNGLAKTLKSARFQKVAQQVPAALALAEQTRDALQTETDELGDTRAFVDQLEGLNRQLDELGGRLP